MVPVLVQKNIFTGYLYYAWLFTQRCVYVHVVPEGNVLVYKKLPSTK